MTREERAREVLATAMASKHRGNLVREGNDDAWVVIKAQEAIAACLAFADAEAAAMRERAAGVADAAADAARPYANGVGMGPAAERHRMKEAETIATAIRALPTTEAGK